MRELNSERPSTEFMLQVTRIPVTPEAMRPLTCATTLGPGLDLCLIPPAWRGDLGGLKGPGPASCAPFSSELGGWLDGWGSRETLPAPPAQPLPISTPQEPQQCP